jgi:hypothetical protein
MRIHHLLNAITSMLLVRGAALASEATVAESPPPQDAAALQASRTVLASPAPTASLPSREPTARDAPAWSTGRARVFVATTVDVGALYLRPRVGLGYGTPHRSWTGLEVNPIIAREMWGAYAGARWSMPALDVRVGARYASALAHEYVQAQASVSRLTLESNRGGAKAFTAETELNGQIPAGPGQVLVLASVSYVMGVPDGSMVLEETLRAIVAPPWVVRGRAGYALLFGPERELSVGLVTDVIAVPERRTLVVRAGALLRLNLNRSLEVRGTFVPRILSPDSVGLLDSDFTELGLRWRWASE